MKTGLGIMAAALWLGVFLAGCEGKAIILGIPDGDADASDKDLPVGETEPERDQDPDAFDDRDWARDEDPAGDPDDAPEAPEESIDIPEEFEDPTCPSSLALQCGDVFHHSTLAQGRADEWRAYACTERLESGRETIYTFEMPYDARVKIRLTDLTTDLDLLRLPTCDPWRCEQAASTPFDIQDGEEIEFTGTPGHLLYVIVDGYAGDEGSYTIQVECVGIDGDQDPDGPSACEAAFGECMAAHASCPQGLRDSYFIDWCPGDTPFCCLPAHETECESGQGYCQNPNGTTTCLEGYEHLPSISQMGCEEYGANCCYPLMPRDCIEAGGGCERFLDACDTTSIHQPNMHCEEGICCIPLSCSDLGGVCSNENSGCEEGWEPFGRRQCLYDQTCCLPDEACPTYISSRARCPYWFPDGTITFPPCPNLAACLSEPCGEDVHCDQIPSISVMGHYCVHGNCVYCWQDDQCPEDHLCRGGRCIRLESENCPETPSCDQPRCSLARLSEVACPVCVCDTVIDDPCATDIDCQPMAHHYFRHCVYGRCAECRSDDECPEGLNCLPPGICYAMTRHPSELYGTWLIGWFGALNHYSYVRFEPDGTLRRGFYESENEWLDDILLGECSVAEVRHPLIGTWEPEVTESGQFILRVEFTDLCERDWNLRERFRVEMGPYGDRATFESIDHPDLVQFEAIRQENSACEADLSSCRVPNFPEALPSR